MQMRVIQTRVNRESPRLKRSQWILHEKWEFVNYCAIALHFNSEKMCIQVEVRSPGPVRRPAHAHMLFGEPNKNNNLKNDDE